MTDTQEAMRVNSWIAAKENDTELWRACVSAAKISISTAQYAGAKFEYAMQQEVEGFAANIYEKIAPITAQSAEKIARLEAENHTLTHAVQFAQTVCDNLEQMLAAAELSNKQFCKVLQQYLDNYGRYDFNKNLFASHVRQVLAQQPSTEALDAYVAKLIPAGWKVVPIEPTQEMINASNGCLGLTTPNEYGKRQYIGIAWHAMIDTAPLPPAPKE